MNINQILDLKTQSPSVVQDLLSPSKLETAFNQPLQYLNGKFILVKFHSLILADIGPKGVSRDINSKLFIYRLLVKNARFSKEDSHEISPRFGALQLFEIVMMEHLMTSRSSPVVFKLFWSDLHDKIKYFLNFFEFVKGDSDQSIPFLASFNSSVKHLLPSSNLERDSLRLSLFNGFFSCNPQIFQPNLPQSKRGRFSGLSSKLLYSKLFIKLVDQALEKLMGFDFERFSHEEKTFPNNFSGGTQENLEKEMGNSILSKNLLEDESIMGSVINLDFNNLNSKQEVPSSKK